jgi:DNA-binding LytR/AlgR family response regulator
MTYKIAICDDSETDIQYISSFILSWANSENVHIRIDTFLSSEAFLFQYTDDKSYDILLLDIEMGKINGIELAKKIREENNAVQIVFITGFPDYITEGYEVSALHYLMKPVCADKLSSVLNKAVRCLGSADKSLIFSVNGEAVRVPVSDIIFVEAFAHSCTVTLVTDTLEIKSGISDIEKLLGDEFIRCHRSYIIGLKYIKRISKTDVTLDTGAKIPLSRSNRSDVNQAFIRFFGG